MTRDQKNIVVPREIAIVPAGPFVFPTATYYVTCFKTDAAAVADMLPEKLVPLPGAEDNILLQVNNFMTYWEAVVSIPVLFQSVEGDVPGIYLSQLYLGSIVPEGSALPMLLGQIGAGYPKRDAIFTVNGFGGKNAEVKFERWGKPIVDMRYDMGEELTDISNLPFGSDLSDLTAFLFKAVPACDGNGWDVLQITTPISETEKVVRVNKVKTRFNGDLVLDSGRVLPVKEQLYTLYYELTNTGVNYAEVLHDYLADRD